MTLLFPSHENWNLLTPQNVSVRRLWGWGHSIQKFVAANEQRPRRAGKLLIASDYSGDDANSTHNVYCYLVARRTGRAWFETLRRLRASSLSSGRRMSFKRLDDRRRQEALVPFLAAASNIDGHLVAIAVDKRKRWLTTAPTLKEKLCHTWQLKGTWKPRSFESMMRKVHFLAIILSIWSRPFADATWITDEDEFVANEIRHDDALLAAARMSSLYCDHPMGVLRLNTTGQDPDLTDFEDICAIPDLAAGMLAKISAALGRCSDWSEGRQSVTDELPTKVDLIADWFWDNEMVLRKTFIKFDVVGRNFGVREIRMVRE